MAGVIVILKKITNKSALNSFINDKIKKLLVQESTLRIML